MDQSADAGVPITPAVENKQKGGKGLKITTAIACIVAVCGIGFGVYGMMKTSSSESSDNSETSNTDSNQELTNYEIRDLTGKTFRLFGFRNGISAWEHYNDDEKGFTILTSYMPTLSLVENNLDDALKTYITLETTLLDEEKYCNYQRTDGVKADIDAALSGRQVSFDADVNFDCISYSRANADYKDLWGEDMPKINAPDGAAYGDFAYGSNTDNYYYHIIGGRGGICTNYTIGRIAEISKNQDSAYVDINAGAFNICGGDAGKLYSDIEENKLYKTIEQDDLDWDNGPVLTEEDYEVLQSYRFVFKKNSDNFYSFSAVEKL